MDPEDLRVTDEWTLRVTDESHLYRSVKVPGGAGAEVHPAAAAAAAGV